MWIVGSLLLVSWTYPLWLYFTKDEKVARVINIACTLIIWILSLGGLYYIYYDLTGLYPIWISSSIRFTLDAPGAVFVFMVITLWLLNLLYSLCYMPVAYPAADNRTFFIYFAMSLASTIVIAFADNLLTLLLGYELLTITTIPLIQHGRNLDSISAAAFYAKMLLGSSLLFLLPAIAHVYFFHKYYLLVVVFILLGVAKAATFPVHSWLPRAMVAPVPVSAFLHAIAVVKSGVFVIYRILSGLEMNIESNYITPQLVLQIWLLFSILYASYQAIRHYNLKLRLAFSTMQQLNVMVIMLLSGHNVLSSVMYYMITHGFAKLTLFLCVGYITLVTKKHSLKEICGIYRIMPVIVIVFAIASATIIGLPFTAGFWSKDSLLHHAQDLKTLWPALSLIVASCGSFLNFAHILYIMVSKPTEEQQEDSEGDKIKHTNMMKTGRKCLYVIIFSGLMCVVLSGAYDLVTRLIDGPGDQPVELRYENDFIYAQNSTDLITTSWRNEA